MEYTIEADTLRCYLHQIIAKCTGPKHGVIAHIEWELLYIGTQFATRKHIHPANSIQSNQAKGPFVHKQHHTLGDERTNPQGMEPATLFDVEHAPRNSRCCTHGSNIHMLKSHVGCLVDPDRTHLQLYRCLSKEPIFQPPSCEPTNTSRSSTIEVAQHQVWPVTQICSDAKRNHAQPAMEVFIAAT